MRIIVVDDHAIVRRGLIQILESMPEISAVDEAHDGNELMERLNQNDYSVIVLDISLPGKSGLEILKEVKALKPNISVLILSIHPETQYAVRAIKAGAAGYITKESAPEELTVAVRTIINERRYITPSLAEKLASDITGDAKKLPHEYLSDREFSVFKMLAAGKTLADIADELFISIKTVSTYKSRIFEKMNLKNRAEITQYAIKNDLID